MKKSPYPVMCAHCGQRVYAGDGFFSWNGGTYISLHHGCVRPYYRGTLPAVSA